MIAAIPVTVVSTPAVRSDRTIIGACSGVISPRSAAAQICAPKPSSVRFSRSVCRPIHSVTGGMCGEALVTSSFAGPKALKAKSPYGSRFSRPSVPMPTASGKTRSGKTSARSVTASNSAPRSSSSATRVAASARH